MVCMCHKGTMLIEGKNQAYFSTHTFECKRTACNQRECDHKPLFSCPTTYQAHLLVAVLAVLRDHLTKETDAIVDAAPVLLLNQVVHLSLVGLLGGAGVRGWRGGWRLYQGKRGLHFYSGKKISSHKSAG